MDLLIRIQSFIANYFNHCFSAFPTLYTFILILNLSLLDLCGASPAWGELISPRCSVQGEHRGVRSSFLAAAQRAPAAWGDWASPLCSAAFWNWSLRLNFSLFSYSGPWPWRGWGRWGRERHAMSAKFPWGSKTQPSLGTQLWRDDHSCVADDAELSESCCGGRLMVPLPSAFPAQ